jgi:hypothetical protein
MSASGQLFVQAVSGIQFESTFDLEIKLKNVILVAFRFFAFLHSQGQFRKSDSFRGRSASLCRTTVLQRIALLELRLSPRGK